MTAHDHGCSIPGAGSGALGELRAMVLFSVIERFGWVGRGAVGEGLGKGERKINVKGLSTAFSQTLLTDGVNAQSFPLVAKKRTREPVFSIQAPTFQPVTFSVDTSERTRTQTSPVVKITTEGVV